MSSVARPGRFLSRAMIPVGIHHLLATIYIRRPKEKICRRLHLQFIQYSTLYMSSWTQRWLHPGSKTSNHHRNIVERPYSTSVHYPDCHLPIFFFIRRPFIPLKKLRDLLRLARTQNPISGVASCKKRRRRKLLISRKKRETATGFDVVVVRRLFGRPDRSRQRAI